ncbi:hypothetical protein ACIBF6_13590 [Streptosporangium amethystogenes]|uniref:hypothetical protein n=1 Tax=Streptosporangium amethystogenes TaxID=2002 RepID=UPI0037AE6D7C
MTGLDMVLGGCVEHCAAAEDRILDTPTRAHRSPTPSSPRSYSTGMAVSTMMARVPAGSIVEPSATGVQEMVPLGSICC